MIPGKNFLPGTCCIMLISLFSCAPKEREPEPDYHARITAAHQERDRAFSIKDAETFQRYYTDSVIGMPEYHPPVYGREGLKRYYQAWFDSTVSTGFTRNIYEVRRIGNHIIDIGTFMHRFKKSDSSVVDYKGKYMNVWIIDAHDSIYLNSEIWGSEHPMDGSLLSFAGKSAAVPPQVKYIDPALEKEVNGRNQQIAAYVKNRQGTLHATEMFMPDAIYLTYDTSMLIGMKNIEPYFTEHEKPGPVSIDSISLLASRMTAIDSFVLEYGYYFVAVSWDNHKGGINVQGKSVNLWKRNREGRLMLWRQMVNHD